MQRVLKKNYTLYADYSGKRVKLYSGTLEEIDDFTTYFVDKNAIRKRLIKNEFGEFLVYIESSRGKYIVQCIIIIELFLIKKILIEFMKK